MIAANTQQAGSEGEAEAFEHLRRHGLKLLSRNWRCKGGELDLVMLDGDTVVFVEVRARRHTAWGGAVESVDGRKQQKLILAASSFLQQESRWAKHPCRFDVVAINSGAQPADRLNWIRNAFEA
ncbi:putative endonuclease [Pseudomonas sp. TE3786]